jgi:hypothetical protein
MSTFASNKPLSGRPIDEALLGSVVSKAGEHDIVIVHVTAHHAEPYTDSVRRIIHGVVDRPHAIDAADSKQAFWRTLGFTYRPKVQ